MTLNNVKYPIKYNKNDYINLKNNTQVETTNIYFEDYSQNTNVKPIPVAKK